MNGRRAPGDHKITRETYLALALAAPKQLLCPNLRNLCWSGDDGLLDYIRLFWGRGTTHLCLLLGAPDIAQRSMLSALALAHPRTSRVSLGWIQSTEQDEDEQIHTAAITGLVCQWQQIKSFEYFAAPLSRQTFLHISRIPSLRLIQIRLPNDPAFPYIQVPSDPAFPALRHAEFLSPSISHCSSLLEVMSPCRLQTISVLIPGTDCGTLLGTFFQRLRLSCARLLLSKVHLWMDERHGVNMADMLINGNMLRPLLPFANMKELSISTTNSFKLDNAMLRDMAMAWPKLQTLELGISGWGAPSGISPAGLIPLLENCQNLRNLSIVIDASTVDFSVEMLSNHKSNTRIRKLKLGDSRIGGDYELIAKFFSSLTPNLTTIHCWGDGVHGLAYCRSKQVRLFRGRWKEVERIIREF